MNLSDDSQIERVDEALKQLKEELRNLRKVDQSLLRNFLDINKNIHRLKAETTWEWQLKKTFCECEDVNKNTTREQLHKDGSQAQPKKETVSLHHQASLSSKYVFSQNGRLNSSHEALLATIRSNRQQNNTIEGVAEKVVVEGSNPMNQPSCTNINFQRYFTDSVHDASTREGKTQNDCQFQRRAKYESDLQNEDEHQMLASTHPTLPFPLSKSDINVFQQRLYSTLPARSKRSNSLRRVRFLLDDIAELNEEKSDVNNNDVADEGGEHSKEENNGMEPNLTMKSCLKKLDIQNEINASHVRWRALHSSSTYDGRKSRSHDDLYVNDSELLRRTSAEIENTSQTNQPIFYRIREKYDHRRSDDDFRRHSFHGRFAYQSDENYFPRSQSLVSLV